MKCPKCGKRTIFDLVKCRRCGYDTIEAARSRSEPGQPDTGAVEARVTASAPPGGAYVCTEQFTAYLDGTDTPEQLNECEALVRQSLAKDADEQVACYRHCIDRYPMLDLGYLRLAQMLPREEARKVLQTGLARCHRKSCLLRRLGEASLELAQWDEAVAFLTSAIFAGQKTPSDSGEAFLLLVPLFVAAGMEEGRWVEKRGQALSGMSMDRAAQIDQVGMIWESQSMTWHTRLLLSSSWLLMQNLESVPDIGGDDMAVRALLSTLPVQSQAALSHLRGTRLLQHADLPAFLKWMKAHEIPVTRLRTVTLLEAAKLIQDLHRLSGQLRRASWVFLLEERDAQRIEMNGVVLAFAQIFCKMDPRSSLEIDGNQIDGNHLWARQAVRTNIDAFVVFGI